MAAKVFISYRRNDSAGHAGRVHDRLEREFGRDLLFMDVDAIPLGVDFVEVLSKEVARCDVLLAIIGPGWLQARSDEGSRRLDSNDDFVRIEIAAALARNIPVIPILLEGTRMPRGEQLPADLKGLVRRNGLDVRHSSFHADMDKLVRGLKSNAAPNVPAPMATGLPADRYRAEGRFHVDAPVIHGAPEGWFLPGAGKTEWFKDYERGPEMVMVPAGTFIIGSPNGEPERYDDEMPREVSLDCAFAVGRHAVTRGQFAVFIAATGGKMPDQMLTFEGEGEKWEVKERKGRSWRNPGFAQEDDHPVVGVSWEDAQAYRLWLSQETQKPYRLMSEAEWEYVARAGTGSAFWWGNTITPAQANYDGNYVYDSGAKGEWRKKTAPVGAFGANPWGLYNVHGNVWEWTEDCWNDSVRDDPGNGRARITGDCSRRVVRGGSWDDYPRFLRSAYRNGLTADNQLNILGFRVARTLNP